MSHLLLNTLWDYVYAFVMEYQNILIPLGLGAIAGLVAQVIIPGRGFGMFATLIIGVVCFVYGNKLLAQYYVYLTSSNTLNHVIVATVCSMVVMSVINLIRGGSDRDKTGWRHS